MEEYQSLSHAKWQCKYRVIFVPKYRRRALFGLIRRELGSVFRKLAEHKGCTIDEGPSYAKTNPHQKLLIISMMKDTQNDDFVPFSGCSAVVMPQ